MRLQTGIGKINSSKRNVCECLRKVADTLDVKQRHVKGGKIASGCGGIVASVLTITGIALSPVTFGASLGLTITGVVLGGISTGGGIGAAVADKKCTETAVQEAQTAIKDFNKSIEDVLKECEDTGNCSIVLASIQGIYDAASRGLGVAAAATSTASSVISTAGDAAVVAGVGLRFMRIGGIVFSALLIPLDVGIIISNSIDIHKKTPSETAEIIRKKADEIENLPIFNEVIKEKLDNILRPENI